MAAAESEEREHEMELGGDRVARLKAAIMEGKEGGRRGRSLGRDGGSEKRKRWSVCGAERRGDLDLETIWED